MGVMLDKLLGIVLETMLPLSGEKTVYLSEKKNIVFLAYQCADGPNTQKAKGLHFSDKFVDNYRQELIGKYNGNNPNNEIQLVFFEKLFRIEVKDKIITETLLDRYRKGDYKFLKNENGNWCNPEGEKRILDIKYNDSEYNNLLHGKNTSANNISFFSDYRNLEVFSSRFEIVFLYYLLFSNQLNDNIKYKVIFAKSTPQIETKLSSKVSKMIECELGEKGITTLKQLSELFFEALAYAVCKDNTVISKKYYSEWRDTSECYGYRRIERYYVLKQFKDNPYCAEELSAMSYYGEDFYNNKDLVHIDINRSDAIGYLSTAKFALTSARYSLAYNYRQVNPIKSRILYEESINFPPSLLALSLLDYDEFKKSNEETDLINCLVKAVKVGTMGYIMSFSLLCIIIKKHREYIIEHNIINQVREKCRILKNKNKDFNIILEKIINIIQESVLKDDNAIFLHYVNDNYSIYPSILRELANYYKDSGDSSKEMEFINKLIETGDRRAYYRKAILMEDKQSYEYPKCLLETIKMKYDNSSVPPEIDDSIQLFNKWCDDNVNKEKISDLVYKKIKIIFDRKDWLEINDLCDCLNMSLFEDY